MKLLDSDWWHGISYAIAVSEEEKGWRVILLNKKSSEVNVIAKADSLSATALKSWLDEYSFAPIVLAFRGDFVFEKIVSRADSAALVASILSVNVENPREFPVLTFPAKNGRILASVIRKNKIDECLELDEIPSSRVIDCCFSEAVMLQTLQLSDKYSNSGIQLSTEKNSYYFSKGEFMERTEAIDFAEATPSDVAAVFDLEPSYAFVASAALFGLLHSRKEEISHGRIQNIRKEYFSVSLMKNIAVVAASFLVFISLTLWGVRTWAEAKNEELKAWGEVNRPITDSLRHTRKKLEARMELREQLGGKTLRSSKASFYGDRLAAIVPEGVKLQKLVFWPDPEDLKKAGLKDGTTVSYDLVMMGAAGESKPVSELSSAIENLGWIKEIKVISSDLNFRNGGYDFVFVLKFNDAG